MRFIYVGRKMHRIIFDITIYFNTYFSSYSLKIGNFSWPRFTFSVFLFGFKKRIISDG